MRRLPLPTAHSLAVTVGFGILAGCGGGAGPRVIHGEVTINGQTADSGEIRFVPTGESSGSVNAASIVDGQYQVTGRGGLPVGTYRVEIVARKKTGKQVEQYNGFELALVDEQVRISPPIYSSSKSPLAYEVTLTGNDQVDFHVDTPAGRQPSVDHRN